MSYTSHALERYVMSPIPFMLVIAGWIHGLIDGALGGSAIYGKSLGELPTI